MQRNAGISRGFTLIELLVVVTIVAVLLSIAGPRYFGSLAKSKEIALQENLKVLRVTLDRYYADRGRYPQALDELVQHKYLRNVPQDPITESDKSWILVGATEGEGAGIVDVKSGAPGNSVEGKPYAAF